MKSKTAERILGETSPETVKRVRDKYVVSFLERNGFTMKEEDVYENEHCTVILFDKYYQISYWSEDFMEDMSYFTDNLSLAGLAGLLSWNDFIPRGYNK